MSSEEGKNWLRLLVTNSGAPLRGDVLFGGGGSFGLTLIAELVRQLDGSLDVKGKPSPEFTITFPWPEYGSGG